MKKILLIIMIILNLIERGSAQKAIDSISVKFVFREGIIQKPEELLLYVVIKNELKRPVYTYIYLAEGDLSDNLCNFSIDLEKNDNGVYKNAKTRHYQTKRNVNSFDSLRHYDLPKKMIGSGCTDTLKFDLLSLGGLQIGEYRFRAHLRVAQIENNSIYNYREFNTEPPFDIINYLTSSWFKFDLLKHIPLKRVAID